MSTRRRDVLTLTRRQISQAAGFLGGAALLMGLVGAIWQGGIGGAVGGALVVGVVGVGLWIALNPAEFVNLVTGRQTRYGTAAVFSTLLLIGIVVMVYIVAERQNINVDLTANRRFSLSETTMRVLDLINRDMQITGFYSPRALAQREIDDQFFRLYVEAADGRIGLEYFDPDENPALRETYGVFEDAQVFISFLNPDGSIDRDTIMFVPARNVQERDMTQAIQRLLVAGSITVYFETGNGARFVLDDSAEGMSGANAALQETGLVTAPLDTAALVASGEPIPQDAVAIILPRLTVEYSAEQIALIDAYLNRGGTLLILSDPLVSADAFLREDSAFNTYLAQRFGLRPLDAVVVDYGASGQTALDVFGAEVDTNTDITFRLDPQYAPLSFRIARAIEVSAPPAQSITVGPLVRSSADSYGERDVATLLQTNTYTRDDADLAPPLVTAGYALDAATGARVVLVGDSDFATNGLLASGGNGLLLNDALAWLTGVSEFLEFGTQAYIYDAPLLALSRQTLDQIAFVTAILMPGALLAAAFAMWARRLAR